MTFVVVAVMEGKKAKERKVSAKELPLNASACLGQSERRRIGNENSKEREIEDRER